MDSDDDEAFLNDRQEPDIDAGCTSGYLYIKKRVDRALEKDNKDEFVQVVNSLPCVEDGLRWIKCFMWGWDSANCAAAVLAGETKISDFNDCLPTKASSSPLHYCAESRAYRIMTLLLKSGFSADTRCDYAPLNLRNVSPLDVALYKLRCLLLSRGYLKGRTSAVKLIIELFGERAQSLGVVGLLAQNSKEAKHDFVNYLKEGKMLEVGALLLGTGGQLLSQSTVEGEFRSISEMHDSLLDANTSLFVGASVTDKNKLIEMEEILLLLEIFNRIGDKLEKILHLNFFPVGGPPMAAASLIEDAGFRVKAEYLYRDNFMSRVNTKDFRSNVLERSVGHCKKTAFTTYLLPSWLRGEMNVLADKSGSTTFPLLSEAPPEMNYMSMSASAPPSSMPEYMQLNHLLKRSAPVLGALKRVHRRG